MRIFFLSSFLCLVLASCGNSQKTAYVNLATLYEKFPLKKQLESNLMQLQNTRKASLDSLYMQVSQSGDENLQGEYLQKRQYFQEDMARVTDQYDKTIWKQINQYVQDYGKENEYDYIFGADGTGTMMYASEGNDITEEVSEYVNNRFAGEKK